MYPFELQVPVSDLSCPFFFLRRRRVAMADADSAPLAPPQGVIEDAAALEDTAALAPPQGVAAEDTAAPAPPQGAAAEDTAPEDAAAPPRFFNCKRKFKVKLPSGELIGEFRAWHLALQYVRPSSVFGNDCRLL